ncbi:3-phenylpropionate/trans-cinnamate dioxygenase ferredoxin reductase subunit [Paramicrobacterium humi]|uniref:3-phenylpropionate/trans-cinnamate dioxygenase ferredoxin reductase subunit n=1 Tax=Paramicrobacterium humi TaxID=640635 RepID=A0A1H4ISJ3_9MICO|nr:FAD-dependent oxidoreductase [Microbacterium humi]SEB37064.1 3-phenylpropionate/trans-cinnamate dioxygenase ferredoxin reductase subunit [Microbacterium humi]
MSTHGTVVVGAGLAAAHTVETLRSLDYADPITLIGDEVDRPYERPGLSKEFLKGETDAASLFVHEPTWYADHDVATRFGTTVTGLDLAHSAVTVDSGDNIRYDSLVLATGSSPRSLPIPGTDLDGVVSLRRIADSEAIRSAFGPGKRIVLIGAGWIGLEVASAAVQAGCTVTVLEYAPLPLQRVLGDELARYIDRVHKAHGVDLRTNVSVTGIEGRDGRATGVTTADGTVPADLVVMGVGAAPNTQLAASAGLDVDGGIHVDEHLRTANPNVLATGDVALAYNTLLGRALRVEHWDNAIRLGKLAAQSIVGTGEVYDWQPYFYTDQFDFGMEYVGHGSSDDDVHIRGDLDAGEFIAFWTSGGRVTAAMNVNIWDVNETLRGIVGREVPSSRLTDTSIPLEELAG